jgi:hypothetical protein
MLSDCSISRNEVCYSPGELRAPELTAVPHCTTSHPPVTPPPQKRDRPLLPSSYHPMGSGPADQELAAVGTGGSESNRVSRAAVETVASPRAGPSTTCTPELLPHHKMSHPPTTSLPQESAQLLSPSTYHTMGDGLADHEPAVAETGGSEFRNASKDASKDESETLTPSQKKRIKRKARKAKRDAEVSQRSGVHTRSERVLRTSPRRKATEAELAASARADIMLLRKQKSGVHTRFPEDGADQTSVLPVSVNAVS